MEFGEDQAFANEGERLLHDVASHMTDYILNGGPVDETVFGQFCNMSAKDVLRVSLGQLRADGKLSDMINLADDEAQTRYDRLQGYAEAQAQRDRDRSLTGGAGAQSGTANTYTAVMLTQLVDYEGYGSARSPQN